MAEKILFDESEFKLDVNNGMSLTILAKKYNMKSCTVSKWKSKLGVISEWKNKIPDKDVFSKEIKMYTNKQLAENYGVGLRLISKWRLKLGLSNVWTSEIIDWEQFYDDCNHLRLYELSEKYRVALSTIKRWKKMCGLSSSSGKRENRNITYVNVGNVNGCWACTSHTVNTNGYPQCKGEKLVVKRIWEERHQKKWPKNLVCIHECDNPWCINPDHVVPGTMKENQGGMAARHRSPWGWRNGVRRLTPEQAKKIYDLKDKGSLRKVAAMFGVSSATVFSIWNGDTWWRDVALIPNFGEKLSNIKNGVIPKRTIIGSPK